MLQPELKHIRSYPEHTQGGVLTLVLTVYRADGLVRLLDLALLTEGKYILDRHIFSIKSKNNERNILMNIIDFDKIKIQLTKIKRSEGNY